MHLRPVLKLPGVWRLVLFGASSIESLVHHVNSEGALPLQNRVSFSRDYSEPVFQVCIVPQASPTTIADPCPTIPNSSELSK